VFGVWVGFSLRVRVSFAFARGGFLLRLAMAINN
jgi:hypothetical protein